MTAPSVPSDHPVTDPNPPSNWRRVSLEPTEDMWAAAFAAGYDSSPADFHEMSMDAVKSLLLPACRAMLAAAPAPPTVTREQEAEFLTDLVDAMDPHLFSDGDHLNGPGKAYGTYDAARAILQLLREKGVVL